MARESLLKPQCRKYSLSKTFFVFLLTMADSMIVLVWKLNRYGIKGINKIAGITISMTPRVYMEMVMAFQRTHSNSDDGS